MSQYISYRTIGNQLSLIAHTNVATTFRLPTYELASFICIKPLVAEKKISTITM